MKDKDIINYLNELIPNPRCELNYKKDYELLLSVMLSAQTTDKRVNMVMDKVYSKYDSLDKLNKLSVKKIEEEIKTIGLYKNKAKNFKSIVTSLVNNEYIVPNDRDYLESLSGVGRKSANVVLGELYNVPCMAVDTHVTRVSKRLGIAKETDDVLTIEKKLTKLFPSNILTRLNEQLVLFGRYHCTAKKPNCEKCKLKNYCKEYEHNK